MLSARSAGRAAARLGASRRAFASASKPVAAAAQPAAAASSAAQPAAFESAAPTYTPSILERLFSSSKAPRVPMDTQWPGLHLTGASAAPRAQPSSEIAISTLPNGIRVATAQSGSPIASVGVFVDGGSRFETPDTNGLTHFLELMSLKSTTNRSDFRLVRDMLKLGASVSASAGREHFIYTADCLQEHVPHVLGTLGDVIQHHAYDAQEIIEEREKYIVSNEIREGMMDDKVSTHTHTHTHTRWQLD